MEQLVLLLVIAAISLINWLIERSAKLREQRRLQKESAKRGQAAPEEEPTVPEVSAREELEEHMRRVMESFGLPVEQPKPVFEKPAPVMVFEEPVVPPPPPLPVPRQTAPRRSKKASVAQRPRSPWVARLATSQGLREAIVLREILGPPRAFSEP
jgi:hypothetical protein